MSDSTRTILYGNIMYNLRKEPKTTLKKLERVGRKTKAVSPVVATLILIIVAIIGAISVGLIVSSVGNNTAGSANQNANKAANGGTTGTLRLGGSTTLFPMDEAAIPTFQNTYNINIVDSQGGSDAGMQGVISGALDIGAASSVNAVHNAFTDVANNNILGVSINYKLIGGSGVVVGTTSTANGQAGPALPGFLVDANAVACNEISRDALALMYVKGTFSIGPVCTAPGHLLTAAGVLTAAPYAIGVNTAPYQTVSRSDAGGTEDAFGAYITGDQGLTYVSGSGTLGGSSNTGSGNAGVLSVTQKCNFAGTAGCVGFFDLGFAEGAIAGVTCQVGWTTSTPCGVAIAQLSSPADTLGTPDALTAATTAAVNQYIAPLSTTSGLHAFIKTALKSEANVNPVTLTGATSIYPDATAPTNSLARTFYYVTNGTPNASELLFINFMTSYNAETYFTSQGFFSQYDFTAA
jgi:phosphate transport system substrate-binding protein